MASVVTPATPVGVVDPTKQAEYPILLGDQLSGKESARNNRFISIKYNHKSKTPPQLQKSTITPSAASQDAFKLTVQGKTTNADHFDDRQTSVYRGSVDPVTLLSEGELNHLVLVFDPKRKAFILEPVSTQLHFNLRSASGKTNKQVAEQYPQLDILPEDDQASSDNEDLGEPDDNNPYDFRHFLPKSKTDAENAANTISTSTTPDPHHLPSKPPPVTSAPSFTSSTSAGAKPKPKPKPIPKAKAQTNPLREQKRPPKSAATTTKPKQPKSTPRVAVEDVDVDSPSDEGGSLPEPADSQDKPEEAAPSPGSNIIVDGDLIIDMGSPPPSRPAFKVNPRHFSSNNTSANEADDDDEDEEEEDDIDEERPPSPTYGGDPNAADAMGEEEDDELAAEMEAAFEESAREEEARSQQMQQYQQQPQYHDDSDDESEVSEEE